MKRMLETMKKNAKPLLAAAVIILLPVLIGVILWNRLPETMATHWDFEGNANGWSGRAFTVFGIPACLLALHVFCVLVSESNGNSCGQNPKLLRIMHGLCPVISLLLAATIYPYALGHEMNMAPMALCFLGVLLLIVGNYLPKCTPNRWLGIRIPWTYASEANWTATHRFGGRVFVAAGLVCLAGMFIPSARAGYAVVAAVLIACFAPMVYSYWYHRKNG